MKNVLFSITLSIILLSACGKYPLSPTPTITELPPQFIDQSLQSGYPCCPPCWYGIEAGESDIDETKETLKSLSFLNSDSIRERESQYWDPVLGRHVNGRLLAVDNIKPEDYQALGFSIVDGRVMDFTLYLNYSFSFEEIINRIGTPDYVRFFNQGGLFPGCNQQLIWLDKGIIASHKSPTDENCSNLSLNVNIGRIVYFHEGWQQIWPLESDTTWQEFYSSID